MFQSEPQLYTDLVIPSAGTDSNWVALDTSKGQFVGIVWPAAFDGTTVTIQASFDGGTTPIKVQDVTFVASEYKDLDPAKYRGIKLIRLKAASAQSGGARTIKLVGSVV